MATTKEASPAVGQAVLGLAVGLLLFSVIYAVVIRARLASAGDPVWLGVFLAVLVLPMVGLALRGRSKATA